MVCSLGHVAKPLNGLRRMKACPKQALLACNHKVETANDSPEQDSVNFFGR